VRWRRSPRGLPHVPRQLPLDPYPLASRRVEKSYRVLARRPTDPEAHTEPAPAALQDEPPAAQRLPRAETRMSALVSTCFFLSIAGSIAFCCCYVFLNIHTADHGFHQNIALGLALATTMFGLGAGQILLAKHLEPPVKAVQHRSEHHSAPDDEHAAEEQLIGGMTELGIAQRRVLRRTLLTALGILPLPFIFTLRDTGPRPENRLRANAWRPHDRMVDPDTGAPLKLGDLAVGSFATVMPEGRTDTSKPINAESVVVVLHLPPGSNHPLAGRQDWVVNDHIAYSKICTHAGCPLGLYEVEEHALVCPCHQSEFDVTHGGRVMYGPAGHSLPQLPIYVDAQGYFRARDTFHVALGPAFWSRTG
jgi:ubiquinol-cytochrome c reductase iron-sulfur subunit